MNKAFLKWAGGKSQSIGMLKDHIGKVEGRFIEPFCGSGVVSLNIEANSFILADVNEDLINTFKELSINKDLFVRDLKKYFDESFNNKEEYYRLRERFNILNVCYEKALIFVYLNRHCFNGLCRYNSKGKFNVPFGKYKSVYFPEKELLDFSEKSIIFKITNSSFEETFKLARKKDVIYADPPYANISESAQASFTGYSAGAFGEEQQITLARLAEESTCRVLISNHDTNFTRKLYEKADVILTKEVNRFISANGNRTKAKELLAIYKGKGE